LAVGLASYLVKTREDGVGVRRGVASRHVDGGVLLDGGRQWTSGKIRECSGKIRKYSGKIREYSGKNRQLLSMTGAVVLLKSSKTSDTTS
jgi:hypothetical protein